MREQTGIGSTPVVVTTVRERKMIEYLLILQVINVLFSALILTILGKHDGR